MGARGALSARVELSRLDLARLPRGLLPEEEGLQGELSGSVEATGTVARPLVAVRASLENGAVRGVAGLALSADARYDGANRRVAGTLSLSRGDGGTLDAEVDVPTPLAGRPAERVRARVRVAAIPIAELLAAARSELPASGALALEVRLDGTAGAPALSAEASLVDGPGTTSRGSARPSRSRPPAHPSRSSPRRVWRGGGCWARARSSRSTSATSWRALRRRSAPSSGRPGR